MKKLFVLGIILMSFTTVKLAASINHTKLVTQYFGIFDDHTINSFYECLYDKPPFKSWDITLIPFIHVYPHIAFDKQTRQFKILWLAGYENARIGARVRPGDRDRDRIKLLMQRATDTNPATNPVSYQDANPNMKFIITLGAYPDLEHAAKNPVEFAESVCKIIKENNLDGFDIDYEGYNAFFSETSEFTNLSSELRTQLNNLGKQLKKKLYLIITTNEPLDLNIVNQYYDYLQIQSYDAYRDFGCNPSDFVNQSPNINSKIILGRDIEGGDSLQSSRYKIDDIPNYINKNNLAGIMGWRVNSTREMEWPNPFAEVKAFGKAFPSTNADSPNIRSV